MKKRNLKLISMILTSVMTLSFLTTNNVKVAKAIGNKPTNNFQKTLVKKLKSKIQSGDNFSGISKLEKDDENSELSEAKNPEEKVRVIVQLENKPATLMLEDGIKPPKKLVEDIKLAQRPIQEQVKNKTGSEINHVFGDLINGFSIEVKRKDIEDIKKIDGVIDVSEVNIYYPDINSAKEFTETLDVWEDYGYEGEGLVVSVIDTGIDPSHKDMRLNDISKAKLSSEDINMDKGKFYTDKVPYGYNFADENDEIVDTTGSMHGMHVAGIIGSNGTEEEVKNNTGVRGVAPEAQLLAMKVFTNNPEIEGAFSDDIIAALEASVALDADIVNFSLGSTSGYRDDDDPEQKAIKNATDDGVICVVSAGNAATSLDPYIVEGISDIGVAGSPGLAEDALQVASSENSIITLPAMEATINNKATLIGYTQCDINPLEVFSSDEKLEVVNCGLGQVEDFEKVDVKGKVALINRGNISFVEKQINAQAAGAIAVVVYNNVEKSEYINMATDSSIKIPVIFITKEDGDAMINGPLSNVTVSFKGNVVTSANPSAATMSSFTSWGPSPNLEFAPQITAPGGNIYSTLNGDKYGTKGGTSMAAPHVAGATALIIQGLKDQGIELEGRELVQYVKNTIINTAKTLTETNAFGEENIPYSPRRQGSGLIQAKSAIDNRVIVTGEDGEATVSLKEIGNSTTFKLNLKNYSNKEKIYNVKSLGDVLTAFTPSMAGGEIYSGIMAFDTVLEGAKLDFNTNKVIVPASGEATIEVTLTVPEGYVNNNFVEGFIKFVPEDKETPDLVVPYMGYYGDYSEEKIIDGLVWEEENVTISPSFLLTKALGDYNYLGYEGSDSNGVIINPDKIAISPNEDGLGDNIVPALYFLRNAKEVAVDLLDEEGKVIAKNIAGGVNYRKKILSSTNGSSADIYSDIDWNGKVYKNQTGNDEVVDEGQYYLNYKSKVDLEDASYQDFIVPVQIDLTPIKVTLQSSSSSESEDYKLKLSFDGELTNGNLQELLIVVNNEILDDNIINEAVIDGDTLTLDLKLTKDNINSIEVLTIDNAYNISDDVFKISVGNCEATAKIENFPDGQYVDSNELIVEGSYSGAIKEILINGEAPDIIGDGKFTKVVSLVEGENTIKLYATDINDKVIANHAHKVYCDTLPPELTLFAPVPNEENIVVTGNEFITVKGAVSDKSEGYSLYLNGEKKLTVEQSGGNEESNYKEFEYEVAVNDGDIVTLKAVDLLGHESIKQFKVSINKEAPIINIEGVENGKAYNTNVTPIITVNDEKAIIEAKLNGEDYNGQEISEEGNYLLTVKAIGSNGIESEISIEFQVDKTSPEIQVSGVEDGKAYNCDILPKVVFEEGSTNLVTLNGEEYDFTAITEEGNYELVIESGDIAGNTTKVVINFEIDKTAPSVVIEDIIDGMKYDNSVKPKITIEEGVDSVITLNDKAYNGEEIKDNGDYVLSVKATDKAGNITEAIVEFSIKLAESNTDNPTPDPKPTPTPGGDGKIENDDNVSNDKSTTTKNNNNKISTTLGKGDKIVNTGGRNTIYPFIIGLVLVVGGAVFILKSKKNKE